MQKVILGLIFLVSAFCLQGCSLDPVNTQPVKTYRFDSDNNPLLPTLSMINKSIMIMPVTALKGFDSKAMLYQNSPHVLSHFVRNAWVAPPATLFGALLVQSLQQAGTFKIVIAGPLAIQTDYLVNITLLALYQDFTVNPSEIVLTLDINLMSNNQVLSTQILNYRVKTQANTPYGGVMAANKAMTEAIADISQLLVSRINQSQS